MKSWSTVQKAYAALIVANIIWGAAAAIFKLSLQNIPLYTLAFWRFFLGALILWALLGKKITLALSSRADAVLLFLYGMLGITLNIIFFFEGLKRTFSINSPIISSAQPILILFLALVFLHETFHWKKFIGMLLGTAGILVIVLEPLLAQGVDGSIIGNIFLVIATLAAVGQTIVGKKIVGRYNPFAFTFWAFLIGAASFLPMAITEYITIPNLYQSLDWRGYLGIGYGAIFSSAAGYGLFAWGLSKIKASDTAVFSYVDPVIGTILGALLLHEPITPLFLVGALLIFGGIYVAEGRIHYHPVLKLFGQNAKPEVLASPPPLHRPIDRKAVLSSIFKKTPET